MILFHDGKQYAEREHDKEADFEKETSTNSKLFFGEDSIFIDAKTK